MNTTIRHISHLLRECDTVAVPGLGVFRRCYSSARFEGEALLPPSEHVVFVHGCDSDDNLLAVSLARSLACSVETSRGRIADDVAEIKNRLEAGLDVVVGDCGVLSAAPALGGIMFEESARFKKANALSWLAPVEPLAVASVGSEIADEVVERHEKQRNVFMQSLQRTASSAAAIALLALIAFVASQLPRKSASEPQMATFGIERIDFQSQSAPVEQSAPDKALLLILNTPADGMSVVDPEAERQRKAAVAEPAPDSDRYFLVVASLASDSEARKFISAYPDSLRLGVLETEGRYRVYAASGESFASTKAVADRTGLTKRFPTAWICRN